ncbi:MAG: S1 RNA-binding domain-containing protein [Planctomycetota bacterium]
MHTDTEALAGAVRILSDRLGRNARLRSAVRKTMRKKGVLRARPLVDEKKAGRHKALLKLNTPLRQLQGHRLTAIRQAQAERVITTAVELDPKEVTGRVRTALGKHTRPELEPLLDDVARKALEQRILPVVEEDVRLELKERSDAEALRFLGSHLRQILLTPFFGRVPVCGVDVSAKGDLALAFLDMHGNVLGETRIEVGDKEPAALGAELVAAAEPHSPEAFAVGCGKSARAAGQKVREALRAASSELPVMVVNDAGASSYANGARARTELADASVPTRLAVTIGRRLQDPMAELLKVDPKQLGLGPEQRLVSKANLRRVLQEAIESAVAFVGCDFDTVPRSVIEHLPGLDEESAKRLADRRDAGDIESREAIRAEGILDEAQWASVAAFLRMRRSPEPLDRTSLHPEQYQLARQLLESAGGGVAETLGRPGATKGLRRQSFEVDEYTWRDLMRELSFPGRDPRGRNRVPEYVSENTDPIRLQPGRVVEGVVTNVASFGAFVDVGRKQDAMVHISQLASRYVRDARELLSIGASVRAKIVDGNSSRLSLSLKDVTREERAEGARRSSTRRRRGGRGGRGAPKEPTGPAGRIWRRDGAAGAATSSRRGTRRGGPRRGGRGDFSDRGERVDLKKLNRESTPANNPFAKFFGKDDEPQPQQQAQPEPQQKIQPEPAPAAPTPPTPEAGASVEQTTEDQ